MAEASEIFKAIVDFVGFLLFAVFQIVRAITLYFIPAAYEPVKSVKGEIVLVTGAGSGLGRLLAIKLAALGAKIVIWDVNVKGLEETAKQIKSNGGTVYSYKCDLTQREEVYKVAEVVKKDVGNVNIVINNAGVVSGYYILDTPDHLIQRTFDVNALALFWTTKAFVPNMVENNRGHVVTIASMAGHMGCPKLADYCASKHAAVGFDEGLRLDLAVKGATGVKTTVICPMFISSTGMFGDVVTKSRRLTAEEVADRVVLAILREDVHVMLPTSMNYVYWLKWVVPWPVISKLMIALVPDAAPTPGSH